MSPWGSAGGQVLPNFSCQILHLSLAGGGGHGITQALLDKPSSFPSPGARGHGITQAFLGITASRLSLAGRAQPRRYR